MIRLAPSIDSSGAWILSRSRSSVDEFVTHVLEKELAKIDESESEEDIKKKLKGLGYIS